MKTTCPHCAQHISIDTETLAELQGQEHFPCPACDGLVPVPQATGAMPVAPVRTDADTASFQSTPTPTAANTPAQAHRGLNRNLLILGSAALLVLGGLGFFLASRSGSIFNSEQKITNEIIHNTYFQSLIASGVTTMKDLDAIADIRPYGNDFIGISKESLPWDGSTAVARRAGALVLDPGLADTKGRKDLTTWLGQTFTDDLAASVWVQEGGQARILDGAEMLVVNHLERPRKVLLRWMTDRKELETIDPANPWRGFDPGPLVLEDALSSSDSFTRMNSVEGQYTPPVKIVNGEGLRLTATHSRSMVWPRAVLGDSSRVEFQVKIPKEGDAGWVMKGSGTGNSPDTGFGFFVRQNEITLQREGKAWMKQKFSSPVENNKWATIQTDIRQNYVAVRINGDLVVSGAAPAALSRPLHGWLGLFGNNSIYRNLRISSSEKDQSRSPQFTPPVTVAPRPNGEEMFTFSEPDGRLGLGWDVSYPQTVKVERGALLLNGYGINEWPRVLSEKALMGDFAVEFTHSCTAPAALNFSFFLAKSSTMPRKTSETEEIWTFKLPEGSGRYEFPGIRAESMETLEGWHEKVFGVPAGSLTSTPYYAPVRNREYRVRVEHFQNSRQGLSGWRAADGGGKTCQRTFVGRPAIHGPAPMLQQFPNPLPESLSLGRTRIVIIAMKRIPLTGFLSSIFWWMVVIPISNLSAAEYPSDRVPAAASASPPASWSNTAGVEIRGKFLHLDGETLVIRKDGKEFRIPLHSLSGASREQARQMAAAGAVAAEQKRAAAVPATSAPVPEGVTTTTLPDPFPNCAPRITDRNAVIEAGKPGRTPSVLIGQYDVELDPLKVKSFTQPGHGKAMLNADGTFAYKPADGFCRRG